MKKLLLKLTLLIIALFIIAPRFYHLGSQPPGLHIDEVSFAADAKSIAQTGRDTWNTPWPTIFKAFGEWKSPGLVYSMAFWTKILGRMDSTVARLPSALAGLTILVMLGLTLRLILPRNSSVAIILSILALSFSPWHFDMSRIFYEAFSALAIFSISLYFVVKLMLERTYEQKLWILAAAFAALSGYWYASIRFIVLVSFALITLVQSWSTPVKLKRGLLALVIILLVGIGWVGDLVSSRGLNRLYYYQNKSAYGASLDINEKRQYCYLSLARNENLAKFCYLLWNKPVDKLTTAAKTYLTYLGTDYLFVSAQSEFGFDSQYGAYLYPLLPFYLVGLVMLLNGLIKTLSALLFKLRGQLSPHDRLYTAIILITLASLAPAAIAGNINMRMSMIALYLVGITIGLGISTTYNYLRQSLRKPIFIFLSLSYLAFFGFYIFQSISHYFLVFTHSNDLAWTSDAPAVFGYVKSVSGNYDRIVDTELHGPLAPYFYGDIATKDVQSGEYSQPDDLGFTYLIKAGKYELHRESIRDLACAKLSNHDLRKTLVITSPIADFTSMRKFAATSWSGALLLHEVYDLDDIINHEIRSTPNYLSRCGPKPL